MQYRIALIPKRNGKYREIYIISKADRLRLRGLIPQLEEILSRLDECGSNYAFQRGRNCVLNAIQHVGYRYTLSMDLEDFFGSISRCHVQSVIPESIIQQCFVNGSPKQGLPTSPIISTIAFLPCDKKIIETLKRLNIDATYTRYADDLIFSFNELKEDGKIRFAVRQIVERSGFTINEEKTKLQDVNNGRVIITGIAVDRSGLYATRRTKKKIRAAIHQNNTGSMKGLVEWSKCRLPKNF